MAGNESNHRLDGLTVEGGLFVREGASGYDVSQHGLRHGAGLNDDSVLYGVQSAGFGQGVLRKRMAVSAAPAMIGAGRVDSHFAPGHAWTATNNGASTDLNYTSDFVVESQCVKLVTNAGGVGTPTRLTLSRTGSTTIAGKMLRVWMKLDSASAANISSIVFYLGSGVGAFTAYTFATIWDASAGFATMQYQHPYKVGEWFPVTMSSSGFFPITGSFDKTAVQDWRVTVTDNGVAATIYVGAVELVAKDTDYPTGVVSMVFDDGWSTQYTDAAPYMDRYGFKGTFGIIVDGLGNSGIMTATQIAALHKVGHEVSCHAYFTDDHNNGGGVNGFRGLPAATVYDDFARLKGWATSNGYRGASSWVMPVGASDSTLNGFVARSFGCAVNAGYGAATIPETLPCANPYQIRRIGPGSNYALSPNGTPKTLQWFVDQVFADGGWLVLMFHKFAATDADGLTCSNTKFQGLCDYINTIGVPVRTVGEVMYG